MLKIYPYKLGSESARDLADALGVKRIIPGGKWRPNRWSIVLNWGSGHMHFQHDRVFNPAASVAIAANKLRALARMRNAGVSTVPFTVNGLTAIDWLKAGEKVIVRHKLSANSGNGIEVIRPSKFKKNTVPNAPLYTKYIKKDREFRIHVFCGQVFDFQEKKRKSGYDFDDNPDHALIRSHLNGWIFCRTGVTCPTTVKNEAISAVEALDLDFGAVDVVVANGIPYILEVNTAPGLEQTTLNNYVEQIEKYVGMVKQPPVVRHRRNNIRPVVQRGRTDKFRRRNLNVRGW